MRGFWLLVHVLGFTLWLGGGIATMVAGISAKSFTPAERLKAYKLIGAIQRLLVGPGAIAVVVSGIVLSMPYMRSGDMPGDRKSTRLNSSHLVISYAVFCLKKKTRPPTWATSE